MPNFKMFRAGLQMRSTTFKAFGKKKGLICISSLARAKNTIIDFSANIAQAGILARVYKILLRFMLQ